MLQNKLQALLNANRAVARRHEIVNAGGEEATVYLYDSIDPYYGVNAEQFVKDFAAITAPVIHVRINSPGGDVFDARAIATAIAQSKSKTVCHVDGLAASAASYIAIAGNEVEMSAGSFMMIHKAWTFAFGNSDDLLSTAALLEKIDASLAADYAKKTGKPCGTIESWMQAETWFSAEEAVAEGFADRVCPDPTEDSMTTTGGAAASAWDLSMFANAPDRSVKAATVASTAAVEDDIVAADLAHAERRRRFELIATAN